MIILRDDLEADLAMAAAAETYLNIDEQPCPACGEMADGVTFGFTEQAASRVRPCGCLIDLQQAQALLGPE